MASHEIHFTCVKVNELSRLRGEKRMQEEERRREREGEEKRMDERADVNTGER